MTTRVGAKLATVAFVSPVLLASCVFLEPAPARQLDLSSTSWTATSLDGEGLGDGYRITFPNLDEAELITPCRRIRAGLILDSDGSGLGFVDPVSSVVDCSSDIVTSETEVVDALLATEAWRVDSQDRITLLGPRELQLER